MIDYEVEIFDELARLVLAEFPNAYVSSEHVEAPASFPAVCIVESANSISLERLDSSGEEIAANLGYTINVYDNSEGSAKDNCKRILAIIDKRMLLRNMTRSMSRPVDNAADPSIYRMVARYSGQITKDGTHYRR